MKPNQLITDRLILRRARHEDSEDLFREYFSDFSIAIYLSRKPHLNSEQTNKVLNDWCQKPWDIISDKFAWVIALADTNKAVGIFFAELNEKTKVQIHYGIGKNYSRQGYITEAGLAVIKWLESQSQHRIKEIWTLCDLFNLGSIRVLEKLGFINDGLREKGLILPAFNNIARDCYVFSFRIN